MSFENPQFNNLPSEEHKKEERTLADKLKNKVKKVATLAGIAAVAMTGEGCSPDKSADNKNEPVSHEEKAVVHPETQKSRIRENYELRKKQSQHESKLILDNVKVLMQAGTLSNLDLSTNNFLKYYYQGLNGERAEDIFDEGRQMRVLEIAKKKGIELDLSKKITMNIEGGLVPISATVNGVVIPITDSDYTPKELEIVQYIKKIQNWKPATVESNLPEGAKNKIRQSPDFDKDADF